MISNENFVFEQMIEVYSRNEVPSCWRVKRLEQSVSAVKFNSTRETELDAEAYYGIKVFSSTFSAQPFLITLSLQFNSTFLLKN